MPSPGGPSLPQVRKLVTEIPGPVSRELHARRLGAVTSAVGSTLPVYVEAAGGGVLVDMDGNSLIDLGSGIAVVNVGNAAEPVVEAVRDQVASFVHSCFMVTPYESYVAVCEQLNRMTPGSHDKRSALFNSGAEAVENAVKVARLATGRETVVVLDHAYHGRTALTMAMTAKNLPYKEGFGPLPGSICRVPASYPLRDPQGMSGREAAARAVELIERQVGARNVACVVAEPIQGEGGFVVPAPGFLSGLSDWCAGNGALLVADEVQTGFGRTGNLFAVEHEGVVPDLVVTAKGIAGGLPLSAVTGTAEVMDAVHTGGLGGTYGGNPVACAAALASMRMVVEQDLPARARRIEALLRPRLEDLAARFPQIGEVRGRGAMLALELVRPGTLEPDAALTSAVSAGCHRRGVVTLTCGSWSNVIRLLPPLVIPDELLLEAVTVLEVALTEVTRA